jgi:hypothetical protein
LTNLLTKSKEEANQHNYEHDETGENNKTQVKTKTKYTRDKGREIKGGLPQHLSLVSWSTWNNTGKN